MNPEQNTAEDLKALVREKYAEIARQGKIQNMSSCCGAGGCSTEVYNIMTDSYEGMEGYVESADLGLGCGLPTEFARISKGDVVLDLGSGAGNDCFVARAETGPEGKVIGVDMTEVMVDLARENAEKLGYHNVEFRLGEIEKLPVGGGRVDVVVSNCVLNLVPDKARAFSEIYRVLKPGGHFSISDVVLQGELHPVLRTASEMYVGCVSGALPETEYLRLITQAGFQNIVVQKKKRIVIPDDILSGFLSAEEIQAAQSPEKGIFSITVYAEKPAEQACCAPGCCN